MKIYITIFFFFMNYIQTLKGKKEVHMKASVFFVEKEGEEGDVI